MACVHNLCRQKKSRAVQTCAWGQSCWDVRSYGVVLWEIITGERPDKLRGLRAPMCARLLSSQCVHARLPLRRTA